MLSFFSKTTSNFIKLRVLFALTASFILLPLSRATEEPRIWTSNDGKKLTAKFVSSSESGISLMLNNGKTVSIPENKLSNNDIWYARSRQLYQQTGIQGNFHHPWPKESRSPGDYEVTVINEAPGEYVYETPHFRFISDANLKKSVIKEISEIFETTYEANKALPLSNLPWKETDEKFPALLRETEQSYLDAGGKKGTSGICRRPSTKYPLGMIIVKFDFLGVRKLSQTYTLDRKKKPGTLCHEITHQMMPVELKKGVTWFAEGSAEYIALSPYRNGRINFNNKSFIIDYVSSYNRRMGDFGRNLGKNIKAPSLKHYMTMSQDEFYEKSVSSLNYGIAPLVVHYFYHGDGNKDAQRIKEYVSTLLMGGTSEEANEKLLDGRSWDELANQIKAYWRSSGITINFDTSK